MSSFAYCGLIISILCFDSIFTVTRRELSQNINQKNYLVVETCDDAISDEMKEMAQMLHDSCVEEIGVDESLITKANAGEFTEDAKLKCYMKCLMEQVSAITDDGEIDVELLISMLPEEMVAGAGPVMRSCGTVKGADDCDTVYQTQKCYYTTKPELYFLI